MAEYWSVDVNNDLRPAYYDEFRCLASDCRFSCCKGWNISFNKKDFLSLKRQTGSEGLSQILRGGVRRIRSGSKEGAHYGEFDMRGSVCPLLDEDSLCLLQKECGHSALPDVCKTFPRRCVPLASGYLERSLTPACEGVLQLLWEQPEGIAFLSDPLPKQERKRVIEKDTDALTPYFPAIREFCIDILQDRRFPLPQRIFLMGTALWDLAEGERDIARWLVKARSLPETPGSGELLEGTGQALALFLGNNIRVLLQLRGNDPALNQVQQDVIGALHLKIDTADRGTTIPFEPYLEARQRFEDTFGKDFYFMENLMVSLFHYLALPHTKSREELWKSYVNFCNLYAFYRFMAVMSCREHASGDKEELFRVLILPSRNLIHNGIRQSSLRDEYFRNDSATLAHMAILLGG